MGKKNVGAQQEAGERFQISMAESHAEATKLIGLARHAERQRYHVRAAFLLSQALTVLLSAEGIDWQQVTDVIERIETAVKLRREVVLAKDNRVKTRAQLNATRDPFAGE